MTVGVLELRLAIRQALSLKDKRRVVKSLKDRLRSRFDVAVAEVDLQDARQQAVLGVAVVGNDESVLGSVLNKVVDYVRLIDGEPDTGKFWAICVNENASNVTTIGLCRMAEAYSDEIASEMVSGDV